MQKISVSTCSVWSMVMVLGLTLFGVKHVGSGVIRSVHATSCALLCCLHDRSCTRSVMLYGKETWALTSRLESILFSCNRQMLRYMARFTWRDYVSSLEVATRCGVGELGSVLRVRKLRLFGHVVKMDETEILVAFSSTRRPRLETKICRMNLQGKQDLDRNQWRTVSPHKNLIKGH